MFCVNMVKTSRFNSHTAGGQKLELGVGDFGCLNPFPQSERCGDAIVVVSNRPRLS